MIKTRLALFGILALVIVAALSVAAWRIGGRVSVNITQPEGYIVLGREVIKTPATRRFSLGRHELIIGAPGYLEQTVTVSPALFNERGYTFTLSTPILGDDVGVPAIRDDIPYYNVFPYDGGDFLITASDDGEKITKLTIELFMQLGPDDGAAYTQQRGFIVAAAERWLNDNGVPESIPREYID